MAQVLVLSSCFSSSILLVLLLLLLLLHPTLSHNEYSQLGRICLQDSDAANLINITVGNANEIETSPCICKTSDSVSSSRRTLTISRKPCRFSPRVVTAATFAFYGSLCIVVFWIGFAYLCLGLMQNPSILLAASSDLTPSAFCMGDDLSDEYGIVSRRRIRTQNQAANT